MKAVLRLTQDEEPHCVGGETVCEEVIARARGIFDRVPYDRPRCHGRFQIVRGQHAEAGARRIGESQNDRVAAHRRNADLRSRDRERREARIRAIRSSHKVRGYDLIVIGRALEQC